MLYSSTRNNCRCAYRSNLKDISREINFDNKINYAFAVAIYFYKICNSSCNSIPKDCLVFICLQIYASRYHSLILITTIVILSLIILLKRLIA